MSRTTLTVGVPRRRLPWVHAVGAAMLGMALFGSAHADGRFGIPANAPTAYAQECASCHMAYPPGMLPAGSWQRMLSGLDKHYGTDASLDTATTQQLVAWLRANAGTSKRVREEPAQDRITRTAWFERKHRQIQPAVWRLASVKSPANCAACHTGAERGNFDDDNLRLPAGMSPAMRRNWND
jgi:hypothetical protein